MLIDSVSALYVLSAIAQSYAAILGIVTIILIFLIGRGKERLKELDEYIDKLNLAEMFKIDSAILKEVLKRGEIEEIRPLFKGDDTAYDLLERLQALYRAATIEAYPRFDFLFLYCWFVVAILLALFTALNIKTSETISEGSFLVLSLLEITLMMTVGGFIILGVFIWRVVKRKR